MPQNLASLNRGIAMQAAFYERTGAAAEVLHVAELPDPQPGPGEVRVRLSWSGVNPSDVKSRAGLRSKALAFPRVVPHSDGMGVVDAVGEGVPPARVGERVWIWNAAWGRAFGSAAQFVRAVARGADPVEVRSLQACGQPCRREVQPVRTDAPGDVFVVVDQHQLSLIHI